MTRVPEQTRALAHVVSEIREQSEPELDWDRMERDLLSDLERGRQPRYPSPARGRALVGALSLAAAALLGLAVWDHARSLDGAQPDEVVASEDDAPRTLSGADLQDGQRLTTGARPLSVEHAGLGRWVLAAHSASEVRSNAETVVVQLQSGSLTATIVPSARPETFVVEVGKVRVAVHGTEFTVRRDADQAYVVVEEGVVAVSSEGEPEKTLLEAPASGRFHLTGDDAGRALEASGTVRPVRPVRPEPVQKAEEAEPELPKEPTFSDVEAGLDQVENVLRQCLLASTDTGGKVNVSVKTRVTLRIDGSGRIQRHGFAPPLAPALAACARQRLESVSFAPSLTGAHVIRDLSIEVD